MADEQKFSKLSTTIQPIYDAPPVLDSTKPSLADQRNAVSVGLFIASLVSTILSGLFLVIAIVGPRYGFIISNRGSLSPSSAALLTAFLAKVIELTFVMTFLSFLGQILSRRAFGPDGINLANLAMRSWILQPGTLLTQWATVKVAGASVLGLLSLVATALSLLYTTATGALVQPQLRVAPPEHRSFRGNVSTDFVNYVSMAEACKTPIYFNDPYRATACTERKWSAVCGYNFDNYMGSWIDYAKARSAENNRLPIFATLDGAVNVTTAWLGFGNITLDSERFQRIVNNITIAVPHRGVPAAARDSNNRLLQPEDLDGTGSYSITANVPNIFLNALCVNANRTELAPIIYETWPNTTLPTTATDIMHFWPFNAFGGQGQGNNNATVLDELFGWRNQDGTDVVANETRPIFMKYPLPGNTIANLTIGKYGGDMAYLLGKNVPRDDERESDDYFLCSLKVGVTEQCSTRYNASSSGRTLEALCGPEYRYTGANSTGNDRVLPDGGMIVAGFLRAMTLNGGIIDSNSSWAYVLTQLQLAAPQLDTRLPSPAEALLSMTAATALDLVQDIPFVPRWNYTRGLRTNTTQYFNATARIGQYMSGSHVPYQQAFIVILALTFVINILILVYHSFLLRMRLVVDICEPLLTFVLGYNTPRGEIFVGSAHGGLDRTDYAKMFVVEDRDGEVAVIAMETESGIELMEEDSLRRRLHF